MGKVEDRYFLNIAGFGYDVAVLEDSWNVAYLEGSLLYLYCALRQLGSYRGFSVEAEADGRGYLIERADLEDYAEEQGVERITLEVVKAQAEGMATDDVIPAM